MIKQITSTKSSMWLKLTIAIGAIFLFYYLAGLMFPVVMSMAVGFVLYPLVKKFNKVKIGNRCMPEALAVLLSFLLAGMVILALLAFLIGPLVEQVNYVMTHIPELSQRNTVFLQSLLAKEHFQDLPPNVRDLVTQVLETVGSSILDVAKSLMQTTFGVATGMLGLVIVPFIAFYFLKDWKSLRRMVISMFTPATRPLVYKIIRDIGTTLCDYAVGMLKMCLIAGVCITAIASMITPSYALVLGTMAAIFELVPMLGPVICTITASFLAYSSNSSLVLPMLAGCAVYYVLDGQFILPQIMNKSLNIHPVIIILGVLIGGKIFGIMGLVFAVPMLCMGKVLYKYLWHSI